uniref:Transmembrane protein n=1 Tax=Angiostrongylus cantonensis TaxID=6313 RepID=A0A0K0CYZ7_ANGCA
MPIRSLRLDVVGDVVIVGGGVLVGDVGVVAGIVVGNVVVVVVGGGVVVVGVGVVVIVGVVAVAGVVVAGVVVIRWLGFQRPRLLQRVQSSRSVLNKLQKSKDE